MVPWAEIKRRYNEYLRRFEQANLLKNNGESIDLPMKEAMNDEDFGVEFHDVSVDGSRELLLEVDSRRAGIRYLPPDIMPRLGAELTDLLKACICRDHEVYWWFTHDFAQELTETTELFPNGLLENFATTIQLVLAETQADLMRSSETVHSILNSSNTLATYIGYPTLEGFVKVACRRDVELDGSIVDGRKIRRLPRGNGVEYMTSGICSDLGMLLWHLETEVAGAEFRAVLKNMRGRVSSIFDVSPDEIYGEIAGYRNDVLHGRHQAPREYGVILNYISIVIWISILS